jgi:hypothetical protein
MAKVSSDHRESETYLQFGQVHKLAEFGKAVAGVVRVETEVL